MALECHFSVTTVHIYSCCCLAPRAQLSIAASVTLCSLETYISEVKMYCAWCPSVSRHSLLILVSFYI